MSPNGSSALRATPEQFRRPCSLQRGIPAQKDCICHFTLSLHHSIITRALLLLTYTGSGFTHSAPSVPTQNNAAVGKAAIRCQEQSDGLCEDKPDRQTLTYSSSTHVLNQLGDSHAKVGTCRSGRQGGTRPQAQGSLTLQPVTEPTL